MVMELNVDILILITLAVIFVKIFKFTAMSLAFKIAIDYLFKTWAKYK